MTKKRRARRTGTRKKTYQIVKAVGTEEQFREVIANIQRKIDGLRKAKAAFMAALEKAKAEKRRRARPRR